MTRLSLEQLVDIPAKNYVVIATAHPDLDLLSDAAIKSLVGKTARFKNGEGVAFDVEILDISYSSSLIGRRNVFFAFPMSAREKFILHSTFDILY